MKGAPFRLFTLLPLVSILLAFSSAFSRADYTFTTLAGSAGNTGTNDGIAGAARFNQPAGIAVDGAGNVYVSEYANHTIRKITPAGLVSTLAGVGGIVGTNDGVGDAARFNSPEGVVLDSATNLYIADNFNHTIRKLSPDGQVSTLAGTPGLAGYRDGTNSHALFTQPSNMVIDPLGNLYLAEWGFGGQSYVRKITPTGVVTTIKSGLFGVEGIGRDVAGNLFVCEENFNSILEISMPSATVSHWQSVNSPYGGVIDDSGNMYMAGLNDETIRIINSNSVSVVAGVSGVAGSADGMGSNARFRGFRSGIARDSLGSLYVADNFNFTIRKGVTFGVPTLPQSQGVLIGTSVTLSVGAAQGSGMFFYQWLSNGVWLADQTNTMLDLGPVNRSSSGVYSVVVSNSLGSSITFNATVRALVPPIIQTPQMIAGGLVHLQFQDADGGLPYDLTQVQAQWRTNLSGAADTNWQTSYTPFYLTNGYVASDLTNSIALPAAFYRILEQ